MTDGLSDSLLRPPFWPFRRQFWTLTISSVHSYVRLPSDFDWQFKRATPSFASSTSLISPHDFLIRLMTWNLKGQFSEQNAETRSNKELSCSRLQTTRKEDQKSFSKTTRRLREGYARVGERQGIRTRKYYFQCLIPVSQILVYTMIGQFWQFPSTFTSITCLRTRKAKQTWRACETLLHHRFCHLDTRNGFCGSRRTEVIKKMLTGSPLLSFQRFSLDIFSQLAPFFPRWKICKEKLTIFSLI